MSRTRRELWTAATRRLSALGKPLAIFLAVVGGVVLLASIVFIARLDYFGRVAADHILANAVRTSGREMPPTAGPIPYASANIQIVGGMGQGLSCSLPSTLEDLAFPPEDYESSIGLQMRQACAYHDYCYRHGAATYGYTQAECDFALQAQAFRLCAFIERSKAPDAFGRVAEAKCMQDARLVTLGVRIGGSDSFRSLDASSVISVGESERVSKSGSTFFEFDPFPRAPDYTVFRIADAPPAANASPGKKAIYRFRVRPSGISVAFSFGQTPFVRYAEISGNPSYLTAAPVVVRAGKGNAQQDWFVWWQRVSDDQTTGRLFALAPGAATSDELLCVSRPVGCVAAFKHVVAAQIGKERPEDAQIDQLLPADFGKAAERGISMVTLRHHSCRGANAGNAPCYVHAVVRTPSTEGILAVQQPQEPLSISDRFSRKPASIDRNRYRNFAAPLVVLDPPDADAPVIAWTRRDGADYRSEASLRRAAVDPGASTETVDDTALSKGSVRLLGFAEADEPAFVLGRSTDSPILVSLTGVTNSEESSIALREWILPPSDDGDEATSIPTVEVEEKRCTSDLNSEWLLKPAQIIDGPDGGAFGVFSRMQPHVANDGTFARLQLAVINISPDGSCPAKAWRGPEIVFTSPVPPNANAFEQGRNEYVRMSRNPILIHDFDGDGSAEIVLAEGPKAEVPYPLCELTAEGTCS